MEEGGGMEEVENELASSNLFRCKYFVISTLLHCFSVFMINYLFLVKNKSCEIRI